MNQTTTANWRDSVPAAVAAEADEWQGKITVAVNAAVVVAGQALRAMKAQMPHGCFEQWWRDELKLTDRKMVADLMSASELLETQPEVTPLSDLPTRTLGILKRGGPDAVRKAVKRLEQGERITEAKAREIVTPKCDESPQMADPWTPSTVTSVTKEDINKRVVTGTHDLALGLQGLLYDVETPSKAGDPGLSELSPSDQRGGYLIIEQQMRYARQEAVLMQVEKLTQQRDASTEERQYYQLRIDPLIAEAQFLEQQIEWFDEAVLPTLD